MKNNLSIENNENKSNSSFSKEDEDAIMQMLIARK